MKKCQLLSIHSVVLVHTKGVVLKRKVCGCEPSTEVFLRESKLMPVLLPDFEKAG